MKIKSSKSLAAVIKQVKGAKKPMASTEVMGEELQNLIELQREAAQSKLEKSIIKPIGAVKGMAAAEKVQKEYEVAKTGIKSRYGNIAKAFGADAKTAKMLDQLFGKKVSDEELTKLREKYKIKSPEQIKEEKAKAQQEKKEKSLKRDAQLSNIEELSQKIYDIVDGIRLSVEGLANKFGTSQAKEITMKDGKYFDKEGKRIKKGSMEKKAGLSYSKETNRYRDIKSGKFVSAEKARQKMNISATAAKVPAIAKPTALPAGDTGLASKVIGGETKTEDPVLKKLNKIDKGLMGTNKGLTDVLDMFSPKKFYGLIGGAIGALIPGVLATFKWLGGLAEKGWETIKEIGSNIWENIKEFLVGIKLDIPEIMGAFKIPMTDITIGPIGGFTFQPFKFLQGDPESAPSATQTSTGGTAPAAGSMAATPAAAGGGGGGGVPAAPTGGGAPAPAAGGGGSAPAGAPAPAAGGGGGGASRAGTNMPGGGPPRRLGPAAAARGKVDPSAAKNAALAAAAKHGITGPHLAQFMGQLDHESGGFKSVEENLRYSAKRLMEVFPKYYKDPAIAEAEANQPQLIANRVYGGRMGNGPPESGDGYKYRGRGLIQLTGKDNYQRFGRMAGVDLVSNPDMASDLATAADIAAAFYKKNVMDKGVDGTDTTKVTKIINGGSHGLSHRAQLFASYSKDPSALKATGPAPEPMMAAAAEPSPAATQDVKIGGSASGGGTESSATAAAATATAPSAPAATPAAPMVASAAPTPSAPTATPVAPTPQSGYQVAAETTAVASTREAVMAPPSAPPFVPVPTGGGKSSAPPQKPDNTMKASVRHTEDAFTRAISKDFVHPSTFTSVMPV